jgi:uncharacterized protein
MWICDSSLRLCAFAFNLFGEAKSFNHLYGQWRKTFMKFLCDQMLARLGRWLRAAGYDTEIILTSMPDCDILARAINDQRILLTRDRDFLAMHAGDNLVFLHGNTLDECVAELTKKLNIHWQLHLFSRCTLCNSLLIEISNDDSRIPQDIKQRCQHVWVCTSCNKIYWDGSHTKRMKNTLESWMQFTDE